MPLAVGGNSKKKYQVKVGDTGRIFTDPETGKTYDDASFKDMEGDYTIDASGPENAARGAAHYDSGGLAGAVRSAPIIRDQPSLGLAAAAAAAKAKAAQTPNPTPAAPVDGNLKKVSSIMGGGMEEDPMDPMNKRNRFLQSLFGGGGGFNV